MEIKPNEKHFQEEIQIKKNSDSISMVSVFLEIFNEFKIDDIYCLS